MEQVEQKIKVEVTRELLVKSFINKCLSPKVRNKFEFDKKESEKTGNYTFSYTSSDRKQMVSIDEKTGQVEYKVSMDVNTVLSLYKVM